MSGVITAARCWSDSAVGERLSCVFGGETGWRGGDKFGCDGCGDWNVAVLQGPAATAARWFAMTDGVVPGVMRGGRVYEAEVPGPGPDIVAEREYPDEKELGLPSSRRGDWARMRIRDFYIRDQTETGMEFKFESTFYYFTASYRDPGRLY